MVARGAIWPWVFGLAGLGSSLDAKILTHGETETYAI